MYGKLGRGGNGSEDVKTSLAEEAGFESRYTIHSKTVVTFSGRAAEHMAVRGWNEKVFAMRTGLQEREYYRIKSGRTKRPKLKLVTALCIGLKLGSDDRNELLNLAGHPLDGSKERFAVSDILDLHMGDIKTADDFDKYYVEFGVEPDARPFFGNPA